MKKILKHFPKYDDKITNIEDVKGDMQVNVIARIVRIPRIRTFDKNGKEGKVLSWKFRIKLVKYNSHSGTETQIL